MNDFYVYAHYDLNARLRYIGKGCNNRAFVKNGRSKLWLQTFPNNEFQVKFIGENLPEDEAFQLEKKAIKDAFDRGEDLINISSGGYGGAKWQFTDETREYFSRIRSGENHHYWGKKRDPNVIAKLMNGRDQWIAKNGHPKLGKKISDQLKTKLIASSHTPELNRKRGEKMRGRKLSDAHKAKISAGNIGRKMSPELKQRLIEYSKARKGKPGHRHTPESRAKLSAKHMGKKMSNEAIENRLKSWIANGRKTRVSKRVECIDTGVIYQSVKEAALITGGNRKMIEKVVAGKRNTHRNFRWRYID